MRDWEKFNKMENIERRRKPEIETGRQVKGCNQFDSEGNKG